MVSLLADAASTNNFSGYIILILLGVGFFLAVFWVAFPFIVISKFNELLKVERENLNLLRKIAAAQNETNRALQYLVDTAAGEPQHPFFSK